MKITGAILARSASLFAGLLWLGASAAQTVGGTSPGSVFVPGSGSPPAGNAAGGGQTGSTSQSGMPLNRALVFRSAASSAVPCPPRSGWRGRLVLKSQTGTFCSYQWFDGGAPQYSLIEKLGVATVDQSLIAGHSLDYFANGSFSTQSLSDGLTGGLAPGLALTAGEVPTSDETTFTLKQYGWQNDLPPAPHPVRVAVLDTAPAASAYNSDTNAHGRSVGLLIRDLACGGPEQRFSRCNVDVRHELALPLVMSDGEALPNVTHGGNFGGHGDLVDAIRRALASWKPVDQGPLVLNLSLGWFTSAIDQSLISDEERDLIKHLPHVQSLGEFAVFEALKQAYCAGARIVVATGNRANGLLEPTLPGGWATLDPPACHDMPSRAADVSPDPGAWMLPVSAVDAASVPLGTTPELGYAALNAYGLSVSVGDIAEAGYFGAVLPARSGASFGTAGVTAVLASVLSHRPYAAHESAEGLLMQGALSAEDPPSQSMAGLLTLHQKKQLLEKHFRVSLCESLAAVGAYSGICSPFPAPPAKKVSKAPGKADCKSGDACPGASMIDRPSVTETPWIYPQPEGRPPCRACWHMTYASDPNLGLLVVDMDPSVTTAMEVTRIQLELDGVYLYEIPKTGGVFPNSFSTYLSQPGGSAQQALLKQTVRLDGANFVVEEPLVSYY